MNLLTAAETVYNTALTAGDPEICIKNYVQISKNNLIIKNTGFCRRLSDFDKVIVVGAGKATARMAKAIEDIFTKNGLPVTGIISIKYNHAVPLRYITSMEASHPVPDSASIKAAEKIVDLLKHAGGKDLVIALFSGGGSSLLSLPAHGITLNEIQQTTDILLQSGAEIDEINTVRKHISRIKGGNLMRIAYPAIVCNLLLSDVLDNRIDVIASGPFVPDESTFSNALDVCKKYVILDKIPASVKKHLFKGVNGNAPETPKKSDQCFSKLITKITGSNRQALVSAKQKAEQLGFQSLLLSSRIKGEARELGKILSGIGIEIIETGFPVSAPACILTGGETTVTIKGSGKGGRNQECALAAVKEIKDRKNILIFCAGTDGTDGPTNAAGAYCTGETYREGIQSGLNSLEYLLRNDSYNYFRQLGNLITTGPTGTNIMDIYLVFVGNKE